MTDASDPNDDPFAALLRGDPVAPPTIHEASAAERAKENEMLQRAFQRDGRRTRRRNRLRAMRKSLKIYTIVIVFVAALLGVFWWQTSGSTQQRLLPTHELRDIRVVRVIEVTAADRPDPAGTDTEIRNQITNMNQWFRTETTADGAGVTANLRTVDRAFKLEHVTLLVRADLLSGSATPSLEVAQAMSSAGFTLGADEAAIVFIRIRPVSPICGESAARYAVVFSTACSSATAESASNSSRVAAHELLHVLGAVDERCAKHAGANGHVIDNPHDIMYAASSATAAPKSADEHLDPGRDDYWGITKAGCTDIAKLPLWVKAK